MPLDLKAADAAAQILFEARRDGIGLEPLPEGIRPVTASDGYAVQAGLVARLLAANGVRRAGYKIGATNPTARAMLGTNEAFGGVLISSTCYRAPLTIKAEDYRILIIEPEIGLRLGKGLPLSGAPYTPERVAEAVDAAVPSIEVVTSPFTVWNEAGIGCIIGDNGNHACWLHGEFVTDFRQLDLADLPVSLSVNGNVERTGSGRNVDGGPMTVLAWLANFLISMGQELKAGDLVTTGSATQPFFGSAGQELVADFGALGQCRLTIE
jgi:2-keto-4-pentenoate hydratase